MRDIENDVFTKVYAAVMANHPNAFVSNEYEPVISQFPAVTVVESDNSVYERMRTVNIDNADEVMYEINVYSNAVAGKKTEAKELLATVDSTMTSLGFTRRMMQAVPNYRDAKIYRVLCRYAAVVGDGNQENTFLIYQI